MAIETSYTKARANFARLWDRVAADRETVIITRRGEPDVALIAADELSSCWKQPICCGLRETRRACSLL